MNTHFSRLGARSLIALVVLALSIAGVAAMPSSRAAAPLTFHVTLGAASPDMALMGMAFYPSDLTVHRGDLVVFTDYLIEPHTVTFGVDGPITNPFAFFAPQNLTGLGTATFTNTGILNSGLLVPNGPFGNSLALTVDSGPGTYAIQ